LMRIITKKRLIQFGEIHPDSIDSLENWYKIVRSSSFHTPKEVIDVFNTADYVGKGRIIFNISGNK